MSKNVSFDERALRYLLIVFWIGFWVLNVVDHVIPSHIFLFNGRERLATILQVLSTIGVNDPLLAAISLNISTGLMLVATLFFGAALVSLYHREEESGFTLFSLGVVVSVATFVYFSFGDVVFGWRGELLEHSLYIGLFLISWIFYDRTTDSDGLTTWHALMEEYQRLVTYIVLVALVLTAGVVVYHVDHVRNRIELRTSTIEASHIGNGIYHVNPPTIAGQEAFEKSMNAFAQNHPDRCITDIQRMNWPPPDNPQFYIITEPCPATG